MDKQSARLTDDARHSKLYLSNVRRNPIPETEAEYYRRRWVEELGKGAILRGEITRLEDKLHDLEIMLHEVKPRTKGANEDTTGFLEGH